MRNSNLRPFLSALCLLAVFAGFSRVSAGPIRFDQVVQVMNAHPAKGESFNFARLRVASPYSGIVIGIDDGDDDKKKKDQKPTQDTRVITETRTDIVEDEVCDCDQIEPDKERKFPKWALLGLAAIPVAFILIKNKKDTPTPTPTTPTTPTPTITPTPTPTATPTVTPTPPITPTPTPPEPVPEPITILLFGTGLAGVGLAARRRLRKGSSADSDESGQLRYYVRGPSDPVRWPRDNVRTRPRCRCGAETLEEDENAKQQDQICDTRGVCRIDRCVERIRGRRSQS